MQRVHKRLFLLTLFVLVALVAAACGGPDPTATPRPTPTSPPAPQATATPQPTPTPTAVPPTATPEPSGPQGTLTVAMDGLGTESWINRLHPGTEEPVIYSFSDTLIGANATTRALEPRVAESWSVEVGANEAVWSFKLREGIPFHDNHGVATSEDVRFTFAELLKEDTVASGGNVVKGLTQDDISNFEIISPTEFRTHAASLDVSVVTQLSVLQVSPTIQPKAYYEEVGDDGFQRNPIGTGSFSFVSHQPSLQVTLDAVPDHWRQTPDVASVVFLIAPEDASRVAMLRTGQADLAPIAPAFKPELEAAGLRVLSIPKPANVYVTLGGMFPDLPEQNCTECPWVGGEDALKVREALTIAIDRQAIVDRLLFGEGEAAAAPYMWTPGPFQFNDPSWEVPTFDPERAKQLLTEAGYPDGFEIEFAIFPLSGFSEMVNTAEAVAGFWEDIGVTVNRQILDSFSPTLRTKMIERTTAGTAFVLNMIFQDEPLRNARLLFTKGGPLSYLHDPSVQAYLDAAASETNEAKRFEHARALGQRFIDQRLGIPLFSTNGTWGAGDRIESWNAIAGRPYFNNVEEITLSS